MIDVRAVRADPEILRASQRARGGDEHIVDLLLQLDTGARSSESSASDLRHRHREASRMIASAQPAERAELVVAARVLAEEVRTAEQAETLAREALRACLSQIPNICEDAPAGGEADSVECYQRGSVQAAGSWVRDHLEIGEALGMIDTVRGAKVSGARFAFLTGDGALLELALVNLATQHALAAGLTPVIPPALVGPEAMEGTGFLGAHADEVYRLADDDLYLVGTSEVPLAAYHMRETLDGPRRYMGFSSCFRREAGSHGRDTRGIIRTHQFDKVEMLSVVAPEDAEAEHAALLAREESLLQALGLPYRVLDVASGDLGTSAARKYDCEAWLPSQNRWLELTSTSSCTQFQARRLGIRMRTEAGSTHAATLNGTLCAIGRTIVALLENHQRPDGSVAIPPALQPLMQGRTELTPR